MRMRNRFLSRGKRRGRAEPYVPEVASYAAPYSAWGYGIPDQTLPMFFPSVRSKMNQTSVPAMMSSVSQNGITWTFDTEYLVGKFVNGDWWVLDEGSGVTVSSVSPAPTGTGLTYRNGSMVNPTPDDYQAYDGRFYYSADQQVTYPLALSSDDSLISSISREEDYDSTTSTGHRSMLSDAAVLTCVDSIPSVTSFRPPYCGATKPTYDFSDMDVGVLPELDSVDNTPDLTSFYDGSRLHNGGLGPGQTDLSKVWLDHLTSPNACVYIHPMNHMSDYSRELGWDVGDIALGLCLGDAGDRTDLAMYLCQLGIDLYWIIRAGGEWEGRGGQSNGRKFPILCAGLLLNDSEMLDVGVDYPPSSSKFGEDSQTFYISQADVDRELNVECVMTVTSATSTSVTGTISKALGGYSAYPIKGNVVRVSSGAGSGQERSVSDDHWARGDDIAQDESMTWDVDSAWDTTPSPGDTVDVLGYESEDIGVAEWGIHHSFEPEQDNPSLYADYRGVNGAQGAWPGYLLATLAMGLKNEWNNDAWFDYFDRYVGILGNIGTATDFTQSMWDTYRGDY